MKEVKILTESKNQLEESVVKLLDLNSNLCSDYLDKRVSNFLDNITATVNSMVTSIEIIFLLNHTNVSLHDLGDGEKEVIYLKESGVEK
jgi:hypothetical protein